METINTIWRFYIHVHNRRKLKSKQYHRTNVMINCAMILNSRNLRDQNVSTKKEQLLKISYFFTEKMSVNFMKVYTGYNSKRLHLIIDRNT